MKRRKNRQHEGVTVNEDFDYARVPSLEDLRRDADRHSTDSKVHRLSELAEQILREHGQKKSLFA